VVEVLMIGIVQGLKEPSSKDKVQEGSGRKGHCEFDGRRQGS